MLTTPSHALQVIHEEEINARCELLNSLITNIFEDNDSDIHLNPISLDANLGKLSKKYKLTIEEEFLIVFSYAWQIKPHLFLPFVEGFKNIEFRTKYGGYLDNERELYIPTLKTFLEIIISKEYRSEFILKLSDKNFSLLRDGVIFLEPFQKNNNNILDSVLKLSPNFIQYLIGGESPRLDHEIDFPARLKESKVPFDEVVLSDTTKEEIQPLELLLEVLPKIKEDKSLKKYISDNHIFVFSGSPGTGKSLTATTLGSKYNMSTYTLDISRVVSRYVGDFEKAMERVFTRLHGQNCILFIDEADSIFTKRNENVNEAKDKYSNQEMSYLLQRLETFDGIVILASNVRDIRTHVDKAMMRRINHIIEFPFPLANEREQLWKFSLPNEYTFEDGLVDKLSMSYQLSGANIASIMSEVLIKAIYNKTNIITFQMIEPSIKKEFYKRDSTYQVCPDNSPGAILMEQRLGRSAVHNGRRM
ncbi:AAA family ATPase [Flammeovirga yaeyamensis]|uniref:AAA family ATPase n=1 Tax=Flammeovirga yaeyamensis TaxID=367791 RepID=A0AAX1NDG7_9BACT|nr:AAA family ATPase [Flammeovirga yaeyamensis]MBB3701377.1 AAA+ superfamily predicted ATPase [Flammeovirga yaeyamensis]NMF38555.1 ATP-binding protein [Flammeovirga yaeyamensis]QWG04481.1 AAA family ATPase [Flammeovirga yaeyamensis]